MSTSSITSLNPVELTHHHDVTQFASRSPALDAWLKDRALANASRDFARTYVLAEQGRVTGFYAIASSSLGHTAATGALRRNAPNPIPVLLLGRLAVDQGFERRGLGKCLLRHALYNAAFISQFAGVKAMVVEAKDPDAEAFYKKRGFLMLPVPANTNWPKPMYMPTGTIMDALSSEGVALPLPPP